MRKLLVNTRVRRRENLSGIYSDPPISYASKFPHIPRPEPPLSPRLLAVKWACHDLYGEEMPSIAADLLEVGLDTPALRRLAGEMNITSRHDIEPFVGRMFRELSVSYPVAEDEAKLVLTRQIAREVIAGERNAWTAASHLEIVVWSWISEISAVKEILGLNDELNWDEPYRRAVGVLTAELIEIFASLGAPNDRERRIMSLGALDGQGWIADDFDAPLPEDIQSQFEAPFDPPIE